MKVRLQRPSDVPNYCFEVVNAETGEELEFCQSDWGYAPLARIFGWIPCPCGKTDGTVDCKDCNLTTHQLLANAYDYLEERLNTTIDSPYYEEYQ